MEEQTKNTTQPAAPLSPEFLGGGTVAGLEKVRARLLDLTNRNRLLNFRHTKGTLRVVNVDLSTVFARLLDGESVRFCPVPEPPRRPAGARPSTLFESSADSDKSLAEPNETRDLGRPDMPEPAAYAASLGWNTSHDLTTPSGFNADSRVLPVLHYLESLETLSRKVGAAARTAIEESGTNMLYLVFGFLEWYESDDSQQAHLAPLVTVPVSLTRNEAKGNGFECSVEYSGEDIETNWSLVEKARRDFGLEFPPIDEDDDPVSYFTRLQPLLEQKSRWRIRPQLTLTLLSFGKLLMYRDLDAKVWPDIKAHPLVTELFEGRKSETISIHPDEHPIDELQPTGEVPPLVVDADSSQHSALIDAMRGKNLVIEGPPGTGKSQTITNLIAATLTAGKTVLFVSEKLAALEVVRRRLDDIGLGLFCLELHSHKTKKNALLGDLEARLKTSEFPLPADFDQRVGLLEEKKRTLTRYAELINRTVVPFAVTVFDVLWARERTYQVLPFDRAIVEGVRLPSVVEFSKADFIRAEELLTVYANHLAGVLECAPTLDEHPWSWVDGPLTFQSQEQLGEWLQETVDGAAKAIKLIEQLNRTTGLELAQGLQGLSECQDLVRLLPEPRERVLSHVVKACRTPEARAEIATFIEATERSSEAREKLAHATAHGDPASLLHAEVQGGLRQTETAVAALGLAASTAPQLHGHLRRTEESRQLLANARTAFVQIAGTLGCDVPFDLRRAQLLLRCVATLEAAPAHLLHLRTPQLESEDAVRAVRGAAARSSELLEARRELGLVFDFDRIEPGLGVAVLRGHAEALEDSGIFQRWFGSRYRAARRTHERIVRTSGRMSRHERAEHLRSLAGHLEACKRLGVDAACRSALGSSFAGIDTRWTDVLAVVSWYESTFAAIPGTDVDSVALRDILLHSRSEHIAALRSGLAGLQPARAALDALAEQAPAVASLLPSQESAHAPLAEWEQHLKTRGQALGEAVRILAAADLKPEVPVSAIASLLAEAERFKTQSSVLDSLSAVRERLGLALVTTEAVGHVASTLKLADSIASSALPRSMSEWLLSDDYRERLEQARTWLGSAAELGASLSQLREQIRQLAPSRDWHGDLGTPLASVQARASRALAHPEELAKWLNLQRSRTEVAEQGLAKLADLVESQQFAASEVIPAFRFVFYNTLGRAAFAEHPDLFQFSGLTQDQVRAQFAEADREVIRLSRSRAAALVSRRAISSGHQSGPVRTWTDLGLITHEIKKQKRHIPIRQLVRRAGAALQAMKPCFMMGPLSVAQYLPPGKVRFDLIVMDEASQLKPEDAIGAIARGGQIVIVGDPKQLPPTSFFQRLAVEEEELENTEELTALEESESILDVASTLYQPVRRLRWHYRSKHHSLIAFSNREFYQGDLVIFPSAYHESPDLGVKYHSIRNGVFELRRNPREAAAIVDAVLEHMQRRPQESLGVVALNFEQRELIEELLDSRLRTDPSAATFQARMEGQNEPLFIKNLENVQGDERDVIFISVTYGPDARGNQYQRFGPINGQTGHRRLNVLFTRARKRTEVFSSLDPDRIQAEARSSFGLRALKKYLTFAKTGVLETADEGHGQPTNDFERSVGSVLKEKGFDVAAQVGVAGFFVDLAVRHPTRPGSYLLGIECDGASYHSGRSARDRDRLRQEILENQGWKIHRIWSTDWFKSRKVEIDRLLKKIQSLLDNDAEHLLAVQRAKRVSSLRERLLALRDEIKTSFPDSPPEICLLRDSILEAFVSKRPRTRQDWFRVVPEMQRSQTDARQVGRYLDTVLAIIEECSE